MKDSPFRILVVEDDFFVKAEIIRVLKQLGHHVIAEASNGKEGIEKNLELSPEVILMDIGMKGMNGIEAAAIIQKQKPTPIIFLTAHESRDMVELAGKAGASAYLTKPPSAPDISRALIIATARHNDIMELRRLNTALEKKTKDLETAFEQIKTLEGIIPICSNCRKIRDDKGYWNLLESYIEAYSDAVFSHGICPECSDELYGEENWYIEMKKKK